MGQLHFSGLSEQQTQLLPSQGLAYMSFESPKASQATHTQRYKELPNGICTPPDQLRLGPLCATSGNTGPSVLDKLLEPGQALTGAPTMLVWAPEVPPVPQWIWAKPVVLSFPILS